MERAGDIAARMAQRARPAQPETERASTADPAAVQRARRRLAHQRLPGVFHGASVDDAPEAGGVRNQLLCWASGPGDQNLVLAGPVGRGKSHLAAGAVTDAMLLGGGRGRLFRWTTTLALMERSKPGAEDDGGPTIAMLRVAPVAVLDDIGAERDTEWARSILALLLDERWSAGLPTVATTNLGLGPEGALAAHVGERGYSRLIGGAMVITLGGIDRRRGR